MPIHAHPNSGVAPHISEVIDQLIETPPEVAPTESVLPSTAVEVIVEDIPGTEAEAAVVDAIPCFVPIAPELLKGLRPGTLRGIQRLESSIAKLEERADLDVPGQRLLDRLTRLHARLCKSLEVRFERKEARLGRRAKAKSFLAALRARRAAAKASQGPVTKADRITRIRQAYQQGQITKAQAAGLTAAALTGTKPKVVQRTVKTVRTARRVQQRLG
jgi:hypothetical protein